MQDITKWKKTTDSSQRTIIDQTEKYFDENGSVFYVKSEPTSPRQFEQIKLLESLGVPVPSKIVKVSKHKYATLYSGRTLLEVTQEGTANIGKHYQNAGILLKEIHSLLNNSEQIIDEELLKIPDISNSQHIDTFRRIFISKDFPRVKSIFDRELPDKRIIKLFELLEVKAMEINSQLTNTSQVGDIIYGDFKQENILIQDDKIILIDPVLRRGSIYFDLARFCSRFLQEYPQQDTLHLECFLKAYDEDLDINSIAYQGLSLNELIIVDLMNILMYYISDYVSRKRDYRITKIVASDKYFEYIQKLLSSKSILRV